MDKINCDNFKNICRMCMVECCINFPKDAVILDIYHKLTSIQFETNNELPQQICLKCFDFINENHEFSMICKRTHSDLVDCLTNYKNKGIIEEPEIKEETNEEMELVSDELVNNWELNEEMEIIDEITIEEHKIEFVKDELYWETNDSLNHDVTESPNDLVTPISISVQTEDVEEMINTFDSNDLNKETNLSDSESNTNTMCLRSNKKIAKKTIDNEYSSESESSTNSISPINNKKPNKKQNKCKICIGTSSKLRSCKTEHKCELPSVSDIGKNLKVNKRVHSGGRSYKCDQCEKSFTRSNHLISHKRLHSGERPYKCDQCEKSFAESGNLTKHIRVHSGTRPYKCDKCEKSFTQSSSLITHKRVHSGERPYKCNECKKSFTLSHHLKVHKRHLHRGDIK